MVARSVSWRRLCPDEVARQMDAALRVTLYIVQQPGPTAFLLKEEAVKKKVKVYLGDPHLCSCSTFKKRNELCPHILWVLLKRFRIPRSNPVTWQLGLVQREISEIVRGYLTHHSPTPPQRGKDPHLPSSSSPLPQREVRRGDVCPICQDDLLGPPTPPHQHRQPPPPPPPPPPLVYCKYGCGRSVHIKCMKVWARHHKATGSETTPCPLCREEYGPITDHTPVSIETRLTRSEQPCQHLGVACRVCEVCPIVGKCYKCSSCVDYHLCHACFSSGQVHAGHAFLFRQHFSLPWRPVPRPSTRPAPPPSVPSLSPSLINALETRSLSDEDYQLLLSLDAPAELSTPPSPEPSRPRPSHRGVSDRVLMSLHVEPLDGDHALIVGGVCCHLCQGRYVRGDWIKKLPCKHKFHRRCLDNWLDSAHTNCPVDNQPIVMPQRNHHGNMNSRKGGLSSGQKSHARLRHGIVSHDRGAASHDRGATSQDEMNFVISGSRIAEEGRTSLNGIHSSVQHYKRHRIQKRASGSISHVNHVIRGPNHVTGPTSRSHILLPSLLHATPLHLNNHKATSLPDIHTETTPTHLPTGAHISSNPDLLRTNSHLAFSGIKTTIDRGSHLEKGGAGRVHPSGGGGRVRRGVVTSKVTQEGVIQREMKRGAKLIINMTGQSTSISEPSGGGRGGGSKSFTFDYSYWSHDDFEEKADGYLSPTSSTYADQKVVFDDLGRGVLDNAWKGYNCSLFAYGQTGSGKSYSMVGYGVNKGIVPVTCNELFKGIEAKKDSKTEFQVIFSMMEIYNEQVRDLLNPASMKGGGLKIREHPNRGFYVDQLCSVAVKNYKEIEDRMAEGTKNRTIASTNMNATSSRAHTIVAIKFIQKAKNETGQVIAKSSAINLVDLAGSERAESTGAVGTRLQEGAAINKSLSTLGNVIKALADISSGKKALVPFRDSSLTKLLKNALGGNSKTIMIAALSPADINYDETLSTLRFADRAKSIKTKATINETATDKLIRELREENAKLLEMIEKGQLGGGVGGGAPTNLQEGGGGASNTDSEEYQKKMQQEMAEAMNANQQMMEELQKSWEQKLAESEQANKEKDKLEDKKKQKQKTSPHFWNLNEDPQLTNMVIHLVKKGESRIGNQKATPPPDILLTGLSISQEHGVVKNKDDRDITITPGNQAKVMVNGDSIAMETTLHHNDRVMLGSSHLYVFHHPKELKELMKAGNKPPPVTYDQAQGEIATSSGFDMTTEGKSKEDILLQEDLITLMPVVHEANAISEELNKKVIFEIVLVSPQARGLKVGRTEVKVKMRDLVSDHSWMWNRNQFLERKYRMQEMYQNYMEGEEWNITNKEEDPFWEPTNKDTHIGSVHVYLQSLSYNIELEEELAITDYKGKELGLLNVEIFPCKEDGSMLGEEEEEEESFVDDPNDMIGRQMHFVLRIPHARGIPAKYTKDLHCRFLFYLDKEEMRTCSISDTRNPDFLFSHHFTMNPVTEQFLDYLIGTPLIVEVWGKQVESRPSASSVPQQHLTTQQLVTMETARRGSKVNIQTLKVEGDPHLMCELSAAKRRAERLEAKIRLIKELIEIAEGDKKELIEVSDIQEILMTEAPSLKVVATMIKLANQSKKTSKKGESQICSVM